MALSKDDFFNYLYQRVFSKRLGSPDDYRREIGYAICEYLEQNTEIRGVYSGFTPSHPPVPVTFESTAVFKIKKIALPYGTKDGMNPWWAKWCVSLLQPSISIVLEDPLIGTGTIQLTPLVIPKIDDISEVGNIWKPICDTIIKTVKSGIVSSISAECKIPISSGVFTVNLIK